MTGWQLWTAMLALGVAVPLHLALWLPVTDRRLSVRPHSLFDAPTGISRSGAVVLLLVMLSLHVAWTALTARGLEPTPGYLAWLIFANATLAPFLFTVCYNFWIYARLFRLPANRPWVRFPATGFPIDPPTVTVVIPCRNEPFDVVCMTIQSALDLTYPAQRLSVLVADNSDFDYSEFQRLATYVNQKRAEGARLELLHRDGVEGFKAGNLDQALRVVDTELVLFLDVDNSCPTDLLINRVGAFGQDDNLAYVQCYNLPCNHRMGRFASAASALLEQHKFMEYVNANVGGWPFFQGHACLWRTSTLRDISPLSRFWRGESILTEDLCMTIRAIEAGKHGRTEWSPAGYWAPTKLTDFERMLVRWCYGTWQIYLRSLQSIVVRRVRHLSFAGHVGLWRHITADKVETLFPFLLLTLPHQVSATLLLAFLWFISTHLLPVLVVAIRPDANVISVESKPRKLIDIHLLKLFGSWCQIRALLEFVIPRPHHWVPTPKTGCNPLVRPKSPGMFKRTVTFHLVAVLSAAGYLQLRSADLAGAVAVSPLLYQSFGVLIALVVFASVGPSGTRHGDTAAHTIDAQVNITAGLSRE